jgi:XRE family transcriptional regulator, regulator of sulfur utilization
MNLGKVIKQQRVLRGINQSIFAEKCNISQAYLSQIENNQKEPNISTIKDIALVLDIPVAILFFMSLEDSDVKEEFREDFKKINRPLKSMVNEFFSKSDEDD